MKQKLITALMLILLGLGLTNIANANSLIADLSKRDIEIDSDFVGTQVLLFGIMNIPGDIVIVARGPKNSYILRKKEKSGLMWIGNKQTKFKDSLSFYALATNENFYNKPDYQKILKSFKIGLDKIELNIENYGEENNENLKLAFLKTQADKKLYSENQKSVFLLGEKLFKTAINFPANIQRGVYDIDIYLFNKDKLAEFQSIPITVHNIGFDAFIYDFAHDSPLIYGLLAVAFAIIIGFIAGNIFFRK